MHPHASARNSRSRAAWHFLGDALLHAGRYTEALECTRKAQVMDPEFGTTYIQLANIYRMMGRHKDAVEALLKLRRDSRDELRRAFEQGGILAFDKLWLERTLEAMRQGSRISEFSLAILYNEIGDKAQAIEWLEKGYAEGAPSVMMMRAHPRLRSLRGEPRYEKLCAKLGLI